METNMNAAVNKSLLFIRENDDQFCLGIAQGEKEHFYYTTQKSTHFFAILLHSVLTFFCE
jgi:hypothetical protein